MYDFTCNISPLCCFPFWRPADHRDRQSSLTTLQAPTSTLSVPLPYSTVPHDSSGQDSDDARALHQIFSSSSSIRGYHTAATTPACPPTSHPSLDLDFKLGDSPLSKPTGRVQQIHNHIRQKLSGSRLSKSSSGKITQESPQKQPDFTAIDQTSPDQRSLSVVGASQSTAGLSGLLASANASQGGYDSDAKSLNSPVLGSSAGTITISSGFVKRALDKFESRQPSTASVPLDNDLATDHPSSSMKSTPNNTSTLPPPVEGPIASELCAARLSSLKEINSDWQLPAPRRSSSLPRKQDCGPKPTAALSAAAAASEKHRFEKQQTRSSLISELDPKILDFIDSSSRRYSNESAQVAVKRCQNAADSSTPQSAAISVAPSGNIPQARSDSTSGACIDCESIHLFDMRISQRLASHSRLPFPSSPTSANVPCRSCSHDESGTINYPSRVSREHNRQPSDPDTRRLFENLQHRKDQSQSWKTVTSPSGYSHPDLQPSLQENASSCYLSRAGIDRDSFHSIARVTRRSSQVNPHSIAVPGRSFSATLPAVPAQDGLLSPNDLVSRKLRSEVRPLENNWVVPSQVYQRGRSVSLPQRRNDEKSPTPISRRRRESTRNAERMSQVSIGAVLDRRNENLTEIGLRDLQEYTIATDYQSGNTKQSVVNGARFSSGEDYLKYSESASCFDRLEDAADKAREEQRGLHNVSEEEPAGAIWARAFRRALELPTQDKELLTLPRWDRDGRRRSLRASMSGITPVGGEDRRKSLSEHGARRSQSIDPASRPSTTADIDQHGHLCPTARSPLSKDLPTAQDRSNHENGAKWKRSILNLRGQSQATAANRSKSGRPTTPPKMVEAWARFPSHTRAERNGPAGEVDDMIARDFLDSISSTPRESKGPTSAVPKWTTLPLIVQKTLKKGKSKSMTLRECGVRSPAERARQNRKGILGKWKRLYRSRSSDLRKYALYHGHRSSLSLGDALEYPELECLPGEGMLTEHCLRRLQSSLEAESCAEQAHQILKKRLSCPESTQVTRGRLPRAQAIDWARYYASCVGSTSALKSEASLHVASNGTEETAVSMRSLDLRDSTVDFQQALRRQQEQAREQLLDKLAHFIDGATEGEQPRRSDELKRLSTATKTTTDTARESSIKTKDFKIPGSFG